MMDSVLTLYAFAMEDYRCTDPLLLEARREYFAAPEKITGQRITKTAGDGKSVLRCQFRKDGLRWSVKQGRHELQRAVKEKDGTYTIHTQSPDGSVREDCFSADHQLIRVLYYTGKKLRGEIVVADQSLKTAFLITEENSWVEETLIPCPEVPYEDSENYRRYTRILGVPPAIVYTTGGVVCFYPPDIATKAAVLAEKFAQEDTAEKFIETADAAESVTDTPPGCAEGTENIGNEINKRYYACGKIQKGKIITDTLLPQETISAENPPAAPAELPPVSIPVGDGRWQIQFRADGTIPYAGAVQDGERRGFGLRADLDNRTTFAGEWLYHGRQGVMVENKDDHSFLARWQGRTPDGDVTGDYAHFDPEGTLTCCGSTDFGMRRIESHGWYVGPWADGTPNGTGLLVGMDGSLLYQGQWENGRRHGMGTEYRDGAPLYTGHWENDLYHGEGVLHLANGGSLTAVFAQGEPGENAVESDADGRTVYIGGWRNGIRCGEGTLHLPDGSTLSGTFIHGALSGDITQRDPDGRLVYRGGMKDGVRSGAGILYRDELPAYEGVFENNVLVGRGKIFEAGQLVYAGEIRDGIRSGIGAAMQNGHPVYFGQWDDDAPHGCGIRYENGKAGLAGSFVKGHPCGRVNEYRDGRLYRELFFRNGEAEYMIEYADGHPVYAGAMQNGQRNGSGRMLNEFCECVQQGIFQNGVLVRESQVIPRRLEPIPCPAALQGTLYEEMVAAADTYVLGLPWEGGIYSGCTRQGVPYGKGSLVYADHIFAGCFENGHPCGVGTLTPRGVDAIHGYFAPDGEEKITCGPLTYTLKYPLPNE